MTIYFADTSALAKRYLPEVGSMWINSWIGPTSGNITVISQIALVEIASLLSRRQREKSVSEIDRVILFDLFLVHSADEYLIVGPDTPLLETAYSLTFRHPLRALDAIQLASAFDAQNLLGQPPIFVSADTRLLDAAKAEGLAIDNPLNYP